MVNVVLLHRRFRKLDSKASRLPRPRGQNLLTRESRIDSRLQIRGSSLEPRRSDRSSGVFRGFCCRLSESRGSADGDARLSTIATSSTAFSGIWALAWRDVPEKYGNWNSIYRRFRRWSTCGVWESVAIALAETMAESGHYNIDSTIVRAHVSAAGGNVWPAPSASDFVVVT